MKPADLEFQEFINRIQTEDEKPPEEVIAQITRRFERLDALPLLIPRHNIGLYLTPKEMFKLGIISEKMYLNIRKISTNPSWQARYRALMFFSSAKDSITIPFLAEFIIKRIDLNDPGLGPMAIRSLGKIGKSSLPFLIGYLGRKPYWPHREAVYAAFQEIGDPSVISILEKIDKNKVEMGRSGLALQIALDRLRLRNI